MSRPPVDPASDGRPCVTDVFIGHLVEDCDDHWDLRDALKCWIEGAWDEALEYLDEETADALLKSPTT